MRFITVIIANETVATVKQQLPKKALFHFLFLRAGIKIQLLESSLL